MSNKFYMISDKWLEDKELSSSQVLLLGIIHSLCHKNGYCWAANNFLGNKLNLSADQTCRNISKLIKEGYLNVIQNKPVKLGNDKLTGSEVWSSFRVLYLTEKSSVSDKDKILTEEEVKNELMKNRKFLKEYFPKYLKKEQKMKLEKSQKPTENTEDLTTENESIPLGENNEGCYGQNSKQIYNIKINKSFSNTKVLHKGIVLEDDTKKTENLNLINNNKIQNNDNVRKKESFSNKGAIIIQKNNNMKKKGIAPYIDLAHTFFPKEIYPTISAGIITWLKTIASQRRLFSLQEFELQLNNLKQYASITAPGSVGTKFVPKKAEAIILHAINGPYLEFDNLDNNPWENR